MAESDFLYEITELFRTKLNKKIGKLEVIFFRRLSRKPNWSIDQIREEWLLAQNELEKNK